MKQDELLHWISSYETNYFLAKKRFALPHSAPIDVCANNVFVDGVLTKKFFLFAAECCTD